MAKLRFFQVDAFTRVPFAGNPAGVVIDADDLRDDQMQAIARELNNSETAFLLKPDASDHDLRIRFFTPTTEVPSCGHATVASHYVRAKIMGLPACHVRHKIGAGLLGADIEHRDGDYFIKVRQAAPRLSEPYEGERRLQVLNALGLDLDDLVPGLPVQLVDTGNSKVMVPIKSRDTLNFLKPDFRKLVQFHNQVPNAGYFVFALDNPAPGIVAHARTFAPNIGIDEDPVTGNGHGPMGAYLVANGRTESRDGVHHFVGRQGEAIGRKGDVDIWVDVQEATPLAVTIGGHAAIVFDALLPIDEVDS